MAFNFFFTVYESFTQTLVLNHGQCVFGDVCKADKECFFVISVWTWVCFLRFTRSTRRKSLKVCSKGCSKKCTLAPAASWKSLFGTSKNGSFKVDSFKTYLSIFRQSTMHCNDVNTLKTCTNYSNKNKVLTLDCWVYLEET